MTKFNEYLERVYNEVPVDIGTSMAPSESKVKIYKGPRKENKVLAEIAYKTADIKDQGEGIKTISVDGAKQLFQQLVDKKALSPIGLKALNSEIPSSGVPFADDIIEIDIQGNSATLHYRTVDEIKAARTKK